MTNRLTNDERYAILRAYIDATPTSDVVPESKYRESIKYIDFIESHAEMLVDSVARDVDSIDLDNQSERDVYISDKYIILNKERVQSEPELSKYIELPIAHEIDYLLDLAEDHLSYEREQRNR